MHHQKTVIHYKKLNNWVGFVFATLLSLLFAWMTGQDFSASGNKYLYAMYLVPWLPWFLFGIMIWASVVSLLEIIRRRPAMVLNEEGLCLPQLSSDVIPWLDISSLSLRRRGKTRLLILDVNLVSLKNKFRPRYFKGLWNLIAYGKRVCVPITGLEMPLEELIKMMNKAYAQQNVDPVEQKLRPQFGKKRAYKSDIRRGYATSQNAWGVKPKYSSDFHL